jgi:hypothetical protein
MRDEVKVNTIMIFYLIFFTSLIGLMVVSISYY